MSQTYEAGSYSFQDVHLSIIGPNISVTVTGAAEEGYSVEFEGDRTTLTNGADGSLMTSLSAVQNGTVTVRLLKTSVMNQQLANAANFQFGSAANNGKNTIVISDPVRGDTITCRNASFVRIPNINFGMQGGANDWAFRGRISVDLGSGADLTFTG